LEKCSTSGVNDIGTLKIKDKYDLDLGNEMSVCPTLFTKVAFLGPGPCNKRE
jgi:hypothetical protein